VKPVLGVMKIGEFDDAILYRVACDCAGHEHDVTIEIEKDDDTGYVFLTFHKNILWCWWVNNGVIGWLENKWRRFKAAMKLMFTGWIELEESFLLKDPEHIQNFIDALREGLEKVKSK